MAISISNVQHPVYIYGDPANLKPTFTAAGSTGPVAWTSSAGTMNPASGNNTSVLTPPNQTRQITVTARDTANNQTATATVQIYAAFPLHAYFPHEADLDQKTETSESEDVTPESEVYRERGGEFIVFNYVAEDRPISEYKLLRDFWRLHRKVIWFYYRDVANEETLFVKFESGIHRANNSQNRITITCVLKGRIAVS